MRQPDRPEGDAGADGAEGADHADDGREPTAQPWLAEDREAARARARRPEPQQQPAARQRQADPERERSRRHPPGAAREHDGGDEEQAGARHLQDEDRHVGDRDLRGPGRPAAAEAAQQRDADGQPDVRLQRPGQESARVGAVHVAARDRARVHRSERQPPRLGPRDERGEVQRHEHRERHRGDRPQGVRELVRALHAERRDRAGRREDEEPGDRVTDRHDPEIPPACAGIA
ncbi:hypothetical protein GKE82_18745 [Conexibacter sp. W3-3-2]|uniref:hypothetical protein n=1 Tax=Conexibacter sp. W3-3-2 TaxID=2675227 RepID=UPI0012B80AE6|nr:hypothetical protein [Conexibacter sp. W3-3-2]MTD46267.1 hypothetical protein [Conexibacter sp. W3-3-2]